MANEADGLVIVEEDEEPSVEPGVHPPSDPETGEWIHPDPDVRESIYGPISVPEDAPDQCPQTLADVVGTFSPLRRERYAVAVREMPRSQRPIVMGPHTSSRDARSALAADGRRYDGPLIRIDAKPRDRPGVSTCRSQHKTTVATVWVPVVGDHDPLPSPSTRTGTDYQPGAERRE